MKTAQFAAMTAEQAECFMAQYSEQPVRTRLAELVGRGQTVVDLGCGKGYEVRALFASAYYTGVDCSPELIRIARRRNPGYKFIVHDAATIEGKWDVGIIKSTLEYLPKSEAVELYDNARRVCTRLFVVWHVESRVEVAGLGTRQNSGEIIRREVYGDHVIREVLCCARSVEAALPPRGAQQEEPRADPA